MPRCQAHSWVMQGVCADTVFRSTGAPVPGICFYGTTLPVLNCPKEQRLLTSSAEQGWGNQAAQAGNLIWNVRLGYHHHFFLHLYLRPLMWYMSCQLRLHHVCLACLAVSSHWGLRMRFVLSATSVSNVATGSLLDTARPSTSGVSEWLDVSMA